jgi:hypothetical protein
MNIMIEFLNAAHFFDLPDLPEYVSSLGWFKGKSTGNHGFYHQI